MFRHNLEVSVGKVAHREEYYFINYEILFADKQLVKLNTRDLYI